MQYNFFAAVCATGKTVIGFDVGGAINYLKTPSGTSWADDAHTLARLWCVVAGAGWLACHKSQVHQHAGCVVLAIASQHAGLLLLGAACMSITLLL
jgi:hypothetical protein